MMEANPQISVVMGVYNGAEALGKTLASVLMQKGVALEFVIVDDGSSDDTPEILARVVREDTRVRLIRQDHQGLTRALIRGCVEARGELIARQDNGDRSLPERLARQLHMLRENSDAALCSCATRFLTPEGLLLYEVKQSSGDLNHSLKPRDADDFQGPSHHGAVMFRKSAYDKVGGYRQQFRLAQDLDLWKRLVTVGTAISTPWIGYEAVFSPKSLSGRYASQQRELRKIILDMATSTNPQDEKKLLRMASEVSLNGQEEKSEWRGNYYIGSCLEKSFPKEAKEYFRKVVKEKPLHWKAWVKFLR